MSLTLTYEVIDVRRYSLISAYALSVMCGECIWNRCGGATRDRTADLLHAMQALSQLSYSPITDAQIKVCGC